MPTHLTLNEHVAALTASGAALREAAAEAGPTAKVPTCPTWTVTDLVRHQGMIHRWAAANLRGESDHRTSDSKAAAEAAPDLLAWFDDGLAHLVETLRTTPDDAEAMVFLLDAPPPRRFWARRQAHETTIHAVDAMAAAIGRWPTAGDLETVGTPVITPGLAADGIDELLCGFVPRGQGRLRSTDPLTLEVGATDTGHRWRVTVDGDGTRTTPVEGADRREGEPITGTALQLYLGLWNRGEELQATEKVLTQWREQVRVRWR